MLLCVSCLSQVVENVLAECGQDIDAAIRRLNELKLVSTTEHGSSAGQHAAAQPDTAAVPDDHQQQQAQAQHTAEAAAAAAAAAACQTGPQTADQWVDALVQEMAAAKDFGDARNRAGKLLQAFEQFMSSRNKGEVSCADAPFSLCCSTCGHHATWGSLDCFATDCAV